MTGNDVIKTFMATLDKTTLKGSAAVNAAVKACSNFKSATAVINQMIKDCQNSASGNEFLQYYCGINLYNDDTGSVTGLDAGNSVSKNAEDIVPESGELDTSFTKNSFTVNNVTFKLSDDYNKLTDQQKYMWQALYTWWAKNALDLVAECYGTNFGFGSDSSATCKTVTVDFTNDSGSGLAWVSSATNSSGKTTDLDLTINMYYYGSVDNSDVNGKSSVIGAPYLDRTLAHEFTHAAMMANITNFTELPLIIKEGMAELTHGIDDTRKVRIRAIASDSASLQSALDLSVINSDIANYYAGGYIFLRYLAKQAGDPVNVFTNKADYYFNHVNNTLLSALGGNDTVYNYGANVTLKGDSGNDYLVSQVTSAEPTIYGGKGNDTIQSYVEKSSINGGTGNDFLYSGYGYINGTIASGSSGDLNTLVGGKGNDTIYLAKGATNNLIKYANGDGNDIIYGFDSDDTLQITKSGYTTTQSGDNLIVTVGEGQVTLASVSSANIKFSFTNGADYYKNSVDNTVLSGLGGSDTIKNSAKNVTIKGGAGNDILIGGSKADTLIGGNGNDCLKGGKGADYLSGGKGNDTLTGGKGKDIFAYTSGNDVITDYTAGTDKIKFISAKSSIKSYEVDGKDVVLNIGKGTLTLINGADKNITFIDSAGKKSTKKFSASANLDDIMEKNFVGEFEFATAQDTLQSLITFADK